VDALLAGGWLVALEIEAFTSTHRAGPLAVSAGAVAVMALAALIRRRAPLVLLAVIGTLTIVLSGGLAAPERASLVGTYTIFVGGYSVAAYLTQRLAVAGLAGLLAGVVLTTVLRHAPAATAFGGGVMAVLIWLVGRVIRRQRELTAALADATARLAAERADRAALALFDERSRIARDLHTLVARLVTTMVVQSEAAHRLVAAADPSSTRAIRSIELTGRQAMAQLRQMLGVLRNERPAVSGQPQASPAAVPLVVLEPVPS
jgi:signal transduction histidine kinase